MRKAFLVAFAAAAMIASQADAQWYVRGEFNGWSNSANPMTDLGGGHYTYTASGLTPGQATEFKITVNDWSENYPGSNSRTMANASGEIVFHFYQGAQSDGWEPSGYSRVGYADHEQFDWEVIGSMNGWAGGWNLTDLGQVHQGDFPLTGGTTYDFKYRRQGDWGFSIGDNFGNSAANIQYTAAVDGVYRFQLDLEGGRHRVSLVPEPASLSLLGLGALALIRRRR
jgi:hypothetical protein